MLPYPIIGKEKRPEKKLLSQAYVADYYLTLFVLSIPSFKD